MKCCALRWRWKTTPSSGLDEAFRAFQNARECAREDEFAVLPVNSEAPVSALIPVAHLRAEAGQARRFQGASDDDIHSMVQTMEAWVAADRDAIKSCYGWSFSGHALPTTADLGMIGKAVIADTLARATWRTGKDGYDKTEHGGDLHARIDPTKARQRGRHYERLFLAQNRAVMEA